MPIVRDGGDAKRPVEIVHEPGPGGHYAREDVVGHDPCGQAAHGGREIDDPPPATDSSTSTATQPEPPTTTKP